MLHVTSYSETELDLGILLLILLKGSRPAGSLGCLQEMKAAALFTTIMMFKLFR